MAKDYAKILIGLGVAIAAATGAAGCSSDDSSGGTTPPNDSGTPDVTVQDSGNTEDTGTGDDAASGDDGGDAGTSTLYQRLGGEEGIRNAVDAIVAAELADPNIASYFFNQVMNPVPAGHPTEDQIEQCITVQLSQAAGGPQTYTTTVTTLNDAGMDAGSFTCRDMAVIHQPLKISGGTFDKFVTIAGGVLTTAMGTGSYTYTTDDITTVAGVLTGTRAAIVDPHLADAGLEPFPGPDAQ